MTTALARLAALHGIALDYHDIWGTLHTVSAATLRALLAAMGVPAGTDAEIEAALDAYESGQWRKPLAPVVVVRHGTPPALRLHLPGALDAAELHWDLGEEQGAERSGSFAPSSFACSGSITIHDEAFIARELVLPIEPPPGYHRLALRSGNTVIGETLLIVAPTTCYQPAALQNGDRVWGATAQLYALRSERNWGIGDLTDLRTLLEQWAAHGASIIGVSPLHALFPHNPRHASPYSPSSRLFLNVLYLDVEAIADFRECDEARSLVHSTEFQATLHRLRDAELVDYAGVAEAKFRVLAMLYASFRTRHLAAGDDRGEAFRAFCASGGQRLWRHALFEALQEYFFRDDPSAWGWPVWPDAFRNPASNEVERFAFEHADRVQYYQYLQWQADLQLGAVGRRSYELGLGVGLYADLAVSIDRGGAEAWASQDAYAVSVSVGAPPDDFNLRGQNWGLPPLVPDRLRELAYAPFIATLRANMQHAGALRIDHVMGLMRLFWIPAEAEPADGAYVHYPFADLLGILALESQRNHCLVIGEDLGTVPDEVRAALTQYGVLSYRLLYFERLSAGEFKPPAAYPRQALVAASTHDLPTVAGWWDGLDLALRDEFGLFPSEQMREAQIVGRAQDRARLLLALEHEQLLPPGISADPLSLPAMTPEVARALHEFLARAPAQVLVVQLEDVIGMRDQANVPATTEAHPNWRRKLTLPLESWPGDERFVELARALQRLRPARPVARLRREHLRAARIPRATYRLQLHRDFTFGEATKLLPYLAALGVSHVYCSPYLRARPGSRHGYDIVDHAALNPEIGSRDDFEGFVAELERHGMSHIIDMVPNHMAIMGADNAWWMDVLESGPASVYADYFDIDWRPIDPDLVGKVLVPVLGDHYGSVLERGELALVYEAEAGAFAVRYGEHRLPIDPREYPTLLNRALKLASDALPPTTASELDSLIAAFRHLPSRDQTARKHVAERHRDKELHKARLAQLVREQPPLAEAIDRALRQFNGTPGERESFDALHTLLEAQAYRVAYWRVASDEINYRRFFDINDLAALRMENEAVFEATHRLVLELVADGKAQGLRIDHPDGLYDPAAYFRRLQQRYALLASGDKTAPNADGRPLYVVVEKIDAPHEQLPEDWLVHGTTGYRFASLLNGLFVDTAAKARIDRAWRAFAPDETIDFDDAAYRGRREIMQSALIAELTVLANQLLRIARADPRTRDLTISTLWQALRTIAASFPVYRTYVAQRVSAQDRRYIDWAVSVARKRSRAADASVFEFVRNVLLVQPPEGAPRGLEHAYRAFAMRFQQFTAPVTAKGIEDTSFYVFNRLVSLNEVGGDPGQFGTTTKAFHRANAERRDRWPHGMLAGSTHDNKRSADVRARIDVISEMPVSWRLLTRRWSRLNRARKAALAEKSTPSRNDEYLLYQTLVGTFPAEDLDTTGLDTYRERIQRYMVKAAREAKIYTSWISVDAEYESALTTFVAALLDAAPSNAFLADLRANCHVFAWFGALNSLSMTLLQFTSPGVPDLYQGNEFIDLSLVDPDNRRPVDYARRREVLDWLQTLVAAPAHTLAAEVRGLLDTPYDGRAKLWTIWRALELRRQHPEVFAQGDYTPIDVTGTRGRHVVAYARQYGSAGVIAVAGRLFVSLGLDPGELPIGEQIWGDTALDLPFLAPGTRLNNVLTGEAFECVEPRLPLARAFAHFSGALFAYERSE